MVQKSATNENLSLHHLSMIFALIVLGEESRLPLLSQAGGLCSIELYTLSYLAVRLNGHSLFKKLAVSSSRSGLFRKETILTLSRSAIFLT